MFTHKNMPLLIALFILLLILAACGGGAEPAEDSSGAEEAPAAEEAAPELEIIEEEEAMEEEAVEDSLEEVIDGLEATGSERDGGQLPSPARIKVAKGREQTAVLDSNANEPRAETASTETLAAGEVDDNAAWNAYLAYRNSYTNNDVLAVDVSQRRQIIVNDTAGNSILDAQLTISANGQTVTTLQTHSDGTALFFPTAYPIQATNYSVQAVANGVLSTVPLANVGVTTITLSRANTAAAQLDLVILLDATGSMGAEIAQLKANIDEIVGDVAVLSIQPNIRLALVAYRDEGDAYVTRTLNFVNSTNEFADFLDGIEASGGGDYPEALDVALAEAMGGLSWRTTPTVQLAFVIADAPPHVDATSNSNYAFSMQEAAEQGIKIYPIASSGLDAQGEYIFRQLAQFTNGRFLFLIDSSGQNDSAGNTFAVDNFSITALDDLVVEIIQEELSHLP